MGFMWDLCDKYGISLDLYGLLWQLWDLCGIYDLCNKYGISMTHMGSMWDFVVVRGTFQRIYHKPLPGDDSLYIYGNFTKKIWVYIWTYSNWYHAR